MKGWIIVLIIAISGLVGFSACTTRYHPKATHRSVGSWLQEKIELEEIDELFGDIPINDLHGGFNDFIAQIKAGDELWWYRSPSRRGLYYGEEGFAIVRDSDVVDWLMLIHFTAYGTPNG